MTSLGVPEAVQKPQASQSVISRRQLAGAQPRRWLDGTGSPGHAASGGLPRLGLTQLRWITIGVPVAALAILVHLMAFALPQVFQTPVGYVATVVLLLLAVVTFSHLVFAAIERLERRITRQNAHLHVAASVASVLSEPEEPTNIGERVLADICVPLQADAGVIRLIDARTGACAVAKRGPGPDVERLLAVIPEVLEHVSLVGDASLDTDLHGMAEESGFRSLLMVPLVAHGSTEGTLAVASRQAGRFREGDRQLLEQVAGQVGLAAQRSSLLAELVDRNKELRILNDHSEALTSVHETPEVLDVVLRTLVEVSASWSGEFWLEESGRLQLVHRIEAASPGSGPRTMEDGRQMRLSGRRPHERVVRVQRSGAASYEARGPVIRCCLPVRAGGRVIGVVHLVRQRPSMWSARRRRLLETLADQGGVAVSEARQRARARELAVLEERGRIAREMHDGLAQMLGYLNTKSFAIRRTLDDGDVASAASMLADLEEAARDASADVREGVMALRSTDTCERDLLRTVTAYAKKFQRMSGIRVECQMTPDGAAPWLSEMAELQVIRLIQEALSNVRKHSGAALATVSITAVDGALQVCIDDDGHGFAAASADTSPRQSFGLQTMRERAEAVGGHLSVTSAPGQGTHVMAHVPIEQPSVGVA